MWNIDLKETNLVRNGFKIKTIIKIRVWYSWKIIDIKEIKRKIITKWYRITWELSGFIKIKLNVVKE